MKANYGVVVALLALAGCGSFEPIAAGPNAAELANQAAAIVQPLVWDPVEHEAYAAPGTGAISGQAFLRQQGGGVVTCAGSSVIAMPATTYFRRLSAYAKTRTPVQIDDRARGLMKDGQCDAEGNFLFDRLPAGDWLVSTEVKWWVGYLQQGGGLQRQVTVSDGQAARVLLTEADYVAR
jgi:hypothetical protein